MNKNYKKILALLVVFGVLSSLNVWATPGDSVKRENKGARKADNQQKKDERTTKRDDNICEKISERAEEFAEKMTKEENKFQAKSQERATNWTMKKTENEAKQNANRASWDANRAAQFKALEGKSKTEEQKEAVANFEVKVKTAIEARRMAVDSAIKTFQDGVQTEITTRKEQLDKLLTSTKATRQNLLNDAKKSCADGSDAKTVVTTFRSGMQANRATTKTDKQNIAKVNTQVTALIAARKVAVEKASADFRTVMEQARIDLKEAFPTSSTTVTNN